MAQRAKPRRVSTVAHFRKGSHSVSTIGLQVEPGSHVVGGKKIQLKVVGSQIVVRTGGGWVELREFLAQSFGAESEVDLTNVFKEAAPRPGGLKVREVLAADAVFAMEPKKKGVRGKSANQRYLGVGGR